MIRRFFVLLLVCSFPWRPAQAILTAVGLDKNLYTSDFMIGSVIVSVIFTESDGTLDSNTETWSDSRKVQVLNQIVSGLNWWTQQTSSPLGFTIISQTVTTRYEPITRPYYDESLWMPEILTKIGFPGGRFTASTNYINSLRTTYNTDWGFIIWIVDSQNDSNGKFSDNYFAYAYLGGPFLVMTYDNNGYGISNMAVVTAHESGHIFHALDQYAGASSPYDYSHGYYQTINGNHAYSGMANEPNSIMRGGIRWGLDSWSRDMVGWKDANQNGVPDLLDKPTSFSFASTVPTVISGTQNYYGTSGVAVVARQGNVSGNGLTVDTVSKIEYRPASAETWSNATADDGAFDEPSENFTISFPSAQLSQSVSSSNDLQTKVTTYYSQFAGFPGTRSGGGSGTLSEAHAYPNPYKADALNAPRGVTFTSLTPGATLRITNAAGEPVYQKTLADHETSLEWGVVNDEGKKVVTGVYYYLITDTAGNKKTGKIAIIR